MIDFDFIMESEIERVQEIAKMTRDEVIADYILFCRYAEFEVGGKSWSEYIVEAENQF